MSLHTYLLYCFTCCVTSWLYAVCEGFMCGTTVIDKDGISAAVVTAEMTAYLASQGTTVLQHLSWLHDKLVCFLLSLNLTESNHIY